MRDSGQVRLPIIPLIAAALMLVLLLWLGFWQLDRAQQKRDFESAYAAALEASPREVDTLARLRELPRFEAVRIRGRYDADRQGLLDMQTHQGRVGYRVWTPLALDTGGTVLVDRGWIPAGADRRDLPDLRVDESRRIVTGWVSPLPEPGLRLGEADEGELVWPRRLHWPDADAVTRMWGPDTGPLLVLLAPGEPDGFVRDWDPVGPIPPARHLAYAVQWFALAVALLVIVGLLLMRRRDAGAA